jgi:hypothetical protein
MCVSGETRSAQPLDRDQMRHEQRTDDDAKRQEQR